MTDALFLADLDGVSLGGEVLVGGDEGRHAVSVRRIRPGERVFVSDGAGSAIHGEVLVADKQGLRVRADRLLDTTEPSLRVVAAQALAKGDRAEFAVETMTELGISEIVPWRASRSVVKWETGDRGAKQLSRWQSTAREATKQSRRFRVPVVSEPLRTDELCARIAMADACYVLHEEATEPLASKAIPSSGELMLVVGPEGGIAPDELDAFTSAGGVLVSVSDAVLRTSTAGVVALAQLQALAVPR